MVCLIESNITIFFPEDNISTAEYSAIDKILRFHINLKVLSKSHCQCCLKSNL